jgi:hypothetical protein
MSDHFDDLYRRMREYNRMALPLREMQQALQTQKRIEELGLNPSTAKMYSELSAQLAARSDIMTPPYWESLKGIADAIQQQRNFPTSRQIISLRRTALLAGSTLQNIDASVIGPKLRLSTGALTGFVNAVEAHSDAFSDLIIEVGKSLPTDEVSANLMEQAAASIFSESEMVLALAGDPGNPETLDERGERRAELAVEFSDRLSQLLIPFGSYHVRNWQGAKRALRGDNPDKVRHVLSSLRTLWDDLVNKFAPEKVVRKQATEDDYHTTSDGRRILQREARFRYIGRHIVSERLASAWIADAVALVKVYGILNGLHIGDLEIPDAELEMIVLRTEGALLMLISAAQLQC